MTECESCGGRGAVGGLCRRCKAFTLLDVLTICLMCLLMTPIVYLAAWTFAFGGDVPVTSLAFVRRAAPSSMLMEMKTCPPCERPFEGCLRSLAPLSVPADQPCPPCACRCTEESCELAKNHDGLCFGRTPGPDGNVIETSWCRDCGEVGGGGTTSVDDYSERRGHFTREVPCERCREEDDDSDDFPDSAFDFDYNRGEDDA